MVGRWRDERYARYRVARLGNDLVDLEPRQLPAFARLCPLCHLYLYLLGVDKVGGVDPEAPRGHLFRLRRQADAVDRRREPCAVFSALARVAACPELVHCQGYGLVGLFRQRTEAHGARHEVPYDAFGGLDAVDGYRVAAEVEEVADEYGLVFLVGQPCELLELGIAARACGLLQRGYRLGVPGVADAVATVVELPVVGQEVGLGLLAEGHVVHLHRVVGDGLQSDAAYCRRLGAEVCAQQAVGQPYALEYLGAPVRAYGADAHLCHYLHEALLYGLDIVFLGRLIVFLYLVAPHEVVEYCKHHVRA